MQSFWQNYRTPLILAILLHILIVILVSIHFSKQETFRLNEISNQSQIVQAVAIQSPSLSNVVPQKMIAQLPSKPLTQQPPPIPKKPVKPILPIPEPEPAPAPPVQKVEQKLLNPTPTHAQPVLPKKLLSAPIVIKPQLSKPSDELKKEIEIKQNEKIAELKAKQLKVKKALAAQVEKTKQLQAQKIKQLQAQKAQAALKKQQTLLIQKQKALETQQLLSEQKQLQQKLLDEQMMKEQQALAAAQMQQAQGIIDQYKAQILQAIQQHWIVPDNANNQLSCVLLIHIAPGGVVLSVDLIKTSGDPILDRSATVAMLKSSPLPVPQEAAVFDQFRALRLTVKPGDSSA